MIRVSHRITVPAGYCDDWTYHREHLWPTSAPVIVGFLFKSKRKPVGWVVWCSQSGQELVSLPWAYDLGRESIAAELWIDARDLDAINLAANKEAK